MSHTNRNMKDSDESNADYDDSSRDFGGEKYQLISEKNVAIFWEKMWLLSASVQKHLPQSKLNSLVLNHVCRGDFKTDSYLLSRGYQWLVLYTSMMRMSNIIKGK